ncbi:helix-turn-helix domain-containing protein [Escherichia coli]
MAINNFKPFALDPNANVTSQADWEALPALLSGFTAGKASSAQVNKAIRQKGINFRSITDGVDLKTASGRYNFRNILSAAQYESDLNSERTLAGLAVARAKGRVGGRRPKFTDEQWREMGERMATGESRQSVSKTYGVGLSTLYKKFPAS